MPWVYPLRRGRYHQVPAVRSSPVVRRPRQTPWFRWYPADVATRTSRHRAVRTKNLCSPVSTLRRACCSPLVQTRQVQALLRTRPGGAIAVVVLIEFLACQSGGVSNRHRAVLAEPTHRHRISHKMRLAGTGQSKVCKAGSRAQQEIVVGEVRSKHTQATLSG